MSTQLTKNFTLEELTRSAKADAMGLANWPTADDLPRLRATADMLQRVRDTLGVPVVVTSGYRAPAVNKAVGGVTSSDHTKGLAADIVAPSFGKPYKLAKALVPLMETLGIRQIILEGIKGKQWVHLSIKQPEKVVNRVITITDAGVQLGIQEVA